MLRTRLSSSFKMQSQSNDYSYFLTSERDLESLAEDYFSTRPVEEQDDQEDNYDYDFSGDETDQEIDSDVDFDFSKCDTSERSRMLAFVTKHVDTYMEITELHAAPLFKSRILYLTVYNAGPCIIHTPILDCTLTKKKGTRKQRSGYALKTTTRSSLQKCHLMHRP